MAKKKSKPFSAVKAVKSAAREHVGTPPPTRAVPDLKTRAQRKAGKHKPTLPQLIEQSE